MGALDGKVAIVTGGTSGIGERIVELFVEEGARVVVAARRQAEGEALEKRLGVRFIRTDMSSEAEVKAMVDACVNGFGRVDCLINNAGMPGPITSVADMDAANLDEIFAVNVRGVMLATKHAARVMSAQGSGSIVNVASVAAHRGGISGHIYTDSKGAVLAFTRSSAAELGEKGVRVNSISPGAIVTGIFAKLAGFEGGQTDGIDEGNVRYAATDSPRRSDRGHRARRCLFRQRCVEFRQRTGYRDRWRHDDGDERLVDDDGGAVRNERTFEGGGGVALMGVRGRAAPRFTGA